MDTAVQSIHEAVPRIVTADEVARKYAGKAPAAIHFACLYCARPVTICADAIPDDNSHFGAGEYTWNVNSPSPYFRHWRSDPFTHDCPYYQQGKGTTSVPQPPFLPMFLLPTASAWSSAYAGADVALRNGWSRPLRHC